MAYARSVHTAAHGSAPLSSVGLAAFHREQKLTEFKELLKMHKEMGGESSPPSPALMDSFHGVCSSLPAAAAATQRGGGETYRRAHLCVMPTSQHFSHYVHRLHHGPNSEEVDQQITVDSGTQPPRTHAAQRHVAGVA
jgi:hypothetical protein